MSTRPGFSARLAALTPYLALLLLGIVAAAPLFSATYVPEGYDTSFHFWRAVAAERLMRVGLWVPRWAPDMAWGYGYPLFIFQGPLSAQFAALLHILGLAWPLAINAVYGLGLVASAFTLFLVGRTLWGIRGGWGAAALFMFVPYHLYVVYYRSSLSETLAWVFPPLVLWGITRWAVEGRRCGWAVGAVALAALAMTHPVSLYVFAPFFGVWILAESLGSVPGQRWRTFTRGLMVLISGVLLGAFAWLPALLEREFVQLGRATSAWVFDYRENFLPLSQLFPWPRAADPHLLNDWPARGLGALFALAALVSLLALRARVPRVRARVGALAVVMMGFTFLSCELSRPLWAFFPWLRLFQFPWRFLAPATLAMVLLIGAGLARVMERWGRYGVTLSLVVMLAGAHGGWLYPHAGMLPAPASPAGLVAWEQATSTLGTTASGELLPRWVATMPPRDAPLTLAVLEGATPARLDASRFPEATRVLSAVYRPTSATLHIDVSRAFLARYLSFYYPGWQVRIDGDPVAVMPEPETGWVNFWLPAGTHTVEVRFAETSRRLFADGLSVLGLILLSVGLYKLESVAIASRPSRSSDFPVVVLVVIFVFMVLNMGGADQVSVLWRHSRWQGDGHVAGVDLPLSVNFDGRAVLLGVEGLPSKLAGDEIAPVTFYWQALAPGTYDWHMALTLVGPEGARKLPVNLRPLRWGRSPPPLAEWPPDAYARMDYELHLPPGMPPGTYTLRVSFFDRESLVPASVLGPDGNPQGPDFALGYLRVAPPQQPASLPELAVARAQPVQQCGPLALWAMTADRASAAPGDMVTLRWVWEAVQTPTTAISTTLILYDEAGDTLRVWELPPVASWWPTDQWHAGDRWVENPHLRLPGTLESGVYRLVLYLPGCEQALASVSVQVEAPARRWTVPEALTARDVTFGERIRLAGYALDPASLQPGGTLTVRLAWQALVDMEISYRVFVHVVGPEGHILAQSDGEPAGWTRPTTGWAVGEVVLDERRIDIPADVPPGTYTLRVGLYAPDGTRLPTSDEEGGVVLEVLK